jgi:hypothetical protein
LKGREVGMKESICAGRFHAIVIIEQAGRVIAWNTDIDVCTLDRPDIKVLFLCHSQGPSDAMVVPEEISPDFQPLLRR